MKKTRVKKGEPYYWIMSSSKYGFLFVYHEEMNLASDNDRWESGNYFNSCEDADAVAKKLNTVLKGADVIEMPSEEDLKSIMPNVFAYGDEFTSGERIGWRNCFDWLKSKIVK